MAELNTVSQGVLRAFADRERCCGYGICMQLCPEVFKADENGLVYLESDIVPVGLEQEATEAAASCPAEALRVAVDTQ